METRTVAHHVNPRAAGRGPRHGAAPVSAGAFALIVIVLATAFAAGTGSAHAGSMVPFVARFSATETIEFDAERCPTAPTVRISGTGVASHLGLFSDEQSHCLDTATGDFSDGVFTFRAANGDTVVGTYQGTAVPVSATLLVFAGQFTITGGTGRWDGATGGGAAAGTIDLAAGTADVMLSGDISSPGANKR